MGDQQFYYRGIDLSQMASQGHEEMVLQDIISPRGMIYGSSKGKANPNLSGRPLPPTPGSSKSVVVIDEAKKREYEEAIMRSVNKVFSDPKKDPTAPTNKPSGEKENAPPQQQQPATASTTTTSRKSAMFKKIGSRTLVRMRRRSKSRCSPNSRLRQLLQSSSATTKVSTPPPPSSSSRLTETPSTATRKRTFLKLMTPLSLRKNKKRERSSEAAGGRLCSSHSEISFYKTFNPFKADRRKEQKKAKKVTVDKASAIKAQQPTAVVSNENIENANNSTKKPPPPLKPARARVLKERAAVINIEGVRYKVSDHGRKLNRVVDETPTTSATAATNVVPTDHCGQQLLPPLPNFATPSQPPLPRHASTRCSISGKVFLEGDEYVEDEPGVLIRSRNSLTRQSITSARNRSINTILKSQARSKQYCMFFNKFGKCNKRDTGVCPFIHDQEKVAVCRKFLQGNCRNENCLLSHKTKVQQQQHLHLQPAAPARDSRQHQNDICPDYLTGCCPAGSNCGRRHVSRCPQFDQFGQCSKGSRCPYPHKSSKGAAESRKVAPAKPKRKSVIPSTPTAAAVTKKARTIGLDDKGQSSEQNQELKEKEEEEKKTSLPPPQGEEDLDDSGPYEEIYEGDEEGEGESASAIVAPGEDGGSGDFEERLI